MMAACEAEYFTSSLGRSDAYHAGRLMSNLFNIERTNYQCPVAGVSFISSRCRYMPDDASPLGFTFTHTDKAAASREHF